MANLELDLFLCRTDNFGVLVHDPVSGATASIDAPEEQPILGALKRRGWTLTVYSDNPSPPGPRLGEPGAEGGVWRHNHRAGERGKQNPGIDRTIGDGGHFDFAGHRVNVFETPGHTAGHICFHFPEDKLLFSADTLFALGCGRLFEGTPAQMWASLQKLMALPDDTTVYFGHEYTQSNARFALTVDPQNEALKKRAADIDAIREGTNPDSADDTRAGEADQSLPAAA